jgi:type VI secretion system secreted protein Hcp
MSNPAYLFLTDENGSPMVGPALCQGVKVQLNSNRSLIMSTSQSTGIPEIDGDAHTHARHVPEEFDRVTPILFRALSTGRTLQSATIKMYQINEAGLEQEYFNILLENVKITSITPDLYPAQTPEHTLRRFSSYEKITGSIATAMSSIVTPGMSEQLTKRDP